MSQPPLLTPPAAAASAKTPLTRRRWLWLAGAGALAAAGAAGLALRRAAPGQPPCINPTGNARLATPGTGDVLAGLIGARLAAGAHPWPAACQAAWQHGALADDWPALQSLTAGELARRLRP